MRDSRQVARSLVEAYAASCFRVSPPPEGRLRPGATVELPLDVPAIASETTLTVAKGEPRVRVEFVDPDGRTARGSESAFTRSGTGGTIEALRVVRPLNGTWRIRLTAPGGVARQPVGATAMWQGVIRSTLVVEPPTVRTGEQVTARLSPVTRRGYVQDPAELRDLSFTVTATGRALGAGRAVPVRDDGKAPTTRRATARTPAPSPRPVLLGHPRRHRAGRPRARRRLADATRRPRAAGRAEPAGHPAPPR